MPLKVNVLAPTGEVNSAKYQEPIGPLIGVELLAVPELTNVMELLKKFTVPWANVSALQAPKQSSIISFFMS